MTTTTSSLLEILTVPSAWRNQGLRQLDVVLRQLARCGLTASLGNRLDDELHRNMSPRVRDRFKAAAVVAAEHERRLRFGLQLARQALAGSGIPVIVLKGGAYLLGGFPNAAGRLVSDLDLLVPESRLAEAESLFHQANWQSKSDDGYDDRYYREWMHELPPLVHPHHGVTIDLHHNLSPRTGRLKLDAGLLFDRAMPLDEGLLRLCDEDLVLHLCIHLFHDGEFQNGLRELLDLDGVLRHCADREGFWDDLLARAEALGLRRPLYYGCRFSAGMLDTPVPAAVREKLAGAAPMPPGRWLVEAAMGELLLPLAGDSAGPGRRLAELLLLLRAHWLRMPPLMLLRHLLTQAWRRGGLKTKQAAG